MWRKQKVENLPHFQFFRLATMVKNLDSSGFSKPILIILDSLGLNFSMLVFRFEEIYNSNLFLYYFWILHIILHLQFILILSFYQYAFNDIIHESRNNNPSIFLWMSYTSIYETPTLWIFSQMQDRTLLICKP